MKRLRERRGWSQGQLADKVGWDSGYISMIESGKRTPKTPNLKKLAAVFGVDIEELSEDAPQVAEERSPYETQEELFRTLTRQYGRPGDDWRELAAFFEVYRQLPPEQREGWLTVLRFNANIARGEREGRDEQEG